MSIYDRLFRYRESAKRAPLEDFLSEALVDLLQRMPYDVQAGFISLITAGRFALSCLPPERCNLEWLTQYHIEQDRTRGFLDILLKVDGCPTLVIENKIASSIRRHFSRHEDQAGNQLRTYGHWLAGQLGDRIGAVVLLTHTAQPPEDFSVPGANYGVGVRNVARWTAVAAWLRKIAAGDDAVGWRDLAVELHEFLEKRHMTINLMTQADLAGLEQFIPAHERIEATIRKLWNDTAEVRAGYCSRTVRPLAFDMESGSISIWTYALPPLSSASWIALGIGFPSLSPWWRQAGLTEQRQVFISLGSDAELPPFEEASLLPSGWVLSDGGPIVSLPIHELPIDPDDMVDAIAVWASARMREAIDLLKSCPV